MLCLKNKPPAECLECYRCGANASVGRHSCVGVPVATLLSRRTDDSVVRRPPCPRSLATAGRPFRETPRPNDVVPFVQVSVRSSTPFVIPRDPAVLQTLRSPEYDSLRSLTRPGLLSALLALFFYSDPKLFQRCSRSSSMYTHFAVLCAAFASYIYLQSLNSC